MGNAVISTKIDGPLRFSWPQGDIVNGVLQPIVKEQPMAQSIVWSGFVVIPLTDSYTLLALVRNMNATIQIDGEIVFDTYSNMVKSMNMVQNSVYSIRITGISSHKKRDPVSLSLMWSTSTMRQSVIPRTFLYDSAEMVRFSPFLIKVT